MNKKIFLISLVIFLLTGNLLFSQIQSSSGYYATGKIIEGLKMESSILKKNVNYAVYLPPDYDISTRFYPVIYLLHGYSDNETEWIQSGEIQQTVDRGIATREVPPVIVIMPDAGVTWYIDDIYSGVMYEEMMFKEFIPFIDKTYRTRAEKEYRAVSGLSMGGYGSLIWSLHHPDMFSVCAAFSAGVFTDEEIISMPENRYTMYFGKMYGPEKTNGRITEAWKKNSVLELMNTLPKDQVEKVKFYIDCGDDDFLYAGNSALHLIMRNRNIYHEYRIKDGTHNWTYWRTNIGDGLKFIGNTFHR